MSLDLSAGAIQPDWERVKEGLARETTALEQALAAAALPRQRVDLLLRLADYQRTNDAARCEAALREARDLARETGYAVGQAAALAELARMALGRSDLDEVSRLSFSAIAVLQSSPPALPLANAYLQLGWMCDYLGDYSGAMDWAHKGLEVAAFLGVSAIHARLLDLAACIHSQMEDHAEAKSRHASAMAMIDILFDWHARASILNNYAMSLLYAGEMENALAAAQQALDIGAALAMRRYVYNYADTVGEILLAMGRLDQAAQVLEEALRMTQDQAVDISQAYVLKNLGRVCMARGGLAEAETYLQQAMHILASFNARAELALCHQLLSTLRERQGNFPGALEHFKAYYQLREATAGKESARRLAVLKNAYDTQLAQRDAEIERLRNVELQAEIEERKRIQAVLERLATTDMLTGLTNRHHFFTLAEREVERALRYRAPLSMLMIDLDYFKRVNDTLGHIAGDQVLIAVGQVIRSTLREVDLAGRYGGEEFAILLPETPAEKAINVAERLRSAIAGLAVETDTGRVSITASIGAAALTSAGSEEASPLRSGEGGQSSGKAERALAALLDRADRALYSAKHAGRNLTRLYQ